MAEFLMLRDPVMEALVYLRSQFPDVHFADGLPTSWDYQGDKALVVITDTGGRGQSQRILDYAQLTFEVIHHDTDTASFMARHINAILIAWPDLGSGVSHVESNRRPLRYPLNDYPDIPTYMFILTVIFKAEKLTL